jgi:hypothetical protein
MRTAGAEVLADRPAERPRHVRLPRCVAGGRLPLEDCRRRWAPLPDRAYQESNGWRRLSDRTRADYSIWLAEIDKRFGDAPKAAFDLPGIRPVVLEWRDRW